MVLATILCLDNTDISAHILKKALCSHAHVEFAHLYFLEIYVCTCYFYAVCFYLKLEN